jgi:tetratricopeptide (TPR) repeat protein
VPPGPDPPPLLPGEDPPLSKGASLGRYVVLEPLGHGAMGIVYRAFDPELDRRIAVKLLRRMPDFASGEEERLLREGKAMARLSHPNVVTVYDVGTYGDRVFVAMELVEGETLRRWLRTPRSWRETVGMFLQAARGLAAAHAAGIVHRDFKPDNALVGTDGRVRVVDFGLAWTPDAPVPENGAPDYQGAFAKASSDRGSTNFGSTVGTPRYSAPEQLEGKRVDPSADQFAFCASLWEALYGAPPFEGGNLLALLRNVRAGNLPRKPDSPRIPGRVVDALRRGLSAEPEARFPSMDALIGVLEHDTAGARRRWLGVSVAVAVVAIAIAAIPRTREPRPVCGGGEQALAGVWNADRKAAIEQALLASGKPWAGETATRVSGQMDRYGRDWVAMRREACEATSVRHEQSESLLDRRMQCLDDRLEELRALTTLLSRPDEGLLGASSKAAYSLTPLQGCADTKGLLAPVPLPADPAVRAEAEVVRGALAQVKAAKALARYAEAQALAEPLVPRARSLGYPPVEAEALEASADVLESLAQYPRAFDVFHEALWAAERGGDRKRAASVMINLLWLVGVDQGHHEAAHEYAAHAAALLDGLGGDPRMEADLANHEAVVLRDEGHPAEAEVRSRTVVEKRKIVFGTDHPRYAMALNNLAACIADQGRYDESLALSQEAMAINARTLGEHHPDYALSLQSVAADYSLLGRHAEARPLSERALAVLTEALGPEHVRVASAEWSLALIEMRLGERADAERHLRHALSVAERLHGADHSYVADYAAILADLLVREGRYAEAVTLYQRALDILQKDNNGQETAESQAGLGYALLGLGQSAEALKLLETALRWQEQNHGNVRDIAHAKLGVARALRATGGDRRRSRSLAEQAVQAYAADRGSEDSLRDAQEWLAKL